MWQGSYHHYFREKIGLELSEDEESQHKPKYEASSHPRGTVVAPMAGLVVKVMVKNKTKVDEGQPVLVLEAMKMEVCACTILHKNLGFDCLLLFCLLSLKFLT